MDAVNLFNGNLALRLPIGRSYRSDAAFEYQLLLHYNSTSWKGGTLDDSGNAGFGFRLSLGEMKPFPPSRPTSWKLVEPDGTERSFYQTLHPGDPNDSVRYTRDGSYLRLRVLAGNETVVESPDGTRRYFMADGRIRRIDDRFGNFLEVAYPSGTTWRLSDRYRTHHIYFLPPHESGVQRVDRVELAAFRGAKAVYRFEYEDGELVDGPSRARVPLLKRVVLPDGAFYAMSYYLRSSTPDPGGADPLQFDPAGALKSLTLPTLGRYQWRYATYFFPADPLSIPSSPGVREKALYDERNRLVGRFRFEQELDGVVDESRTAVTSPIGDKTVHYFFAKARDWRHGLPFTRNATHGRGFLSQRIYDGSGAGARLVRSLYARYTADEGASVGRGNQRLEWRRTIYHDDGGRRSDVSFSDFDGLGHYRATSTGGTWNDADVRKAYRRFNPAQGNYSYDANTGSFGSDHSFRMVAPSQSWVLDTYDQEWAEEAGVTAATGVCFDRNTGALKRRRAQLGKLPGANDVVYEYTVNARGNVVREETFGGDGGGLAASPNLCALPLPASRYRVDHRHQFGVKRYSAMVLSGGAHVSMLDQTIDKSTGLPSSARSAAGILESYVYDTSGRRTWIKPQSGHDSWSQFIYRKATPPSGLGHVVTREHDNPQTSTVLTRYRLTFDAFGRPFREQQRMPNGSWSNRDTRYNALGLRTSVSEPGNVAKTTRFFNYDPFGRPRRVEPPDGAAHAVTFLYQGDRYVRRTQSVATSPGAETAVVRREFFDRQGRLSLVQEHSGEAGESVATSYAYDVHNNLQQARTTAKVDGRNVTQTRRFQYDGRGFLRWEQHPEKGSSGNGRIYYYRHDPLGLPGRTVDGQNDLTLSYDRAGRVTTVRETTGARRLLKKYDYATANSGTDRRRSQLWKATRYNHLPRFGLTVGITTTYAYRGRGGRISQITTSTDTENRETFVQSYAYDALGNVHAIDYPRCTHATCIDDNPVRNRRVEYVYTRGLLTQVPGYLDAMTYHPNGMLNSVRHANGVTDVWNADPNGMARPYRIYTTGAETNWSSGIMSYDGAGNVKATGAGSFTYDGAGRLTRGSSSRFGNDSQSYRYDPFGNIKSVATTAGGKTTTKALAIQSATNRMAAVSYDASGNQLTWGPYRLGYDAFDQLTSFSGPTNDWVFLQDAHDRRVWAYNVTDILSYWFLRDMNGKVLRWYLASGKDGTMVWTHFKDQILTDEGRLLASHSWGSAVGGDWKWYHTLDHLGTPRLVTDENTKVIGQHSYFPFGEEATDPSQNFVPTKFTGHVRDFHGNLGATQDDLDYMLLRNYSFHLNRFLSTDPVDGDPRAPQSWNQYAYVRGNPAAFVDPNGLFGVPSFFFPLFTFFDEITVTASMGGPGPTEVFGLGTFLEDLAVRINFFDRGIGLDLSNYIVGFGDVVSLGGTKFIRNEQELTHTIDEDTMAYRGGQVTGVAHLVATGGLAGASRAGFRTRVALHGPHHTFGRFGRLSHLQLNTWWQGVKGSGKAFRIPLPWR